jgi:hypothetical protein
VTVPLLEVDRSDELVERIARRVVELLDERAGVQNVALVDAATLGRLLGVSRAMVYEHREELGAVMIGGGARPRLRFDVQTARQAWTARVEGERSQAADPDPPKRNPRRRRAAAQSDARLLPVLGSAPADSGEGDAA